MAETRAIGYLQIVWTIATKDIVDAVKNKASLIFLLLTTAMIVMNNLSFSGRAIPDVLLYSEGTTNLIQKLKVDSGIEAEVVGSFQEMEARLGEKNELVLGLHVPVDDEGGHEANGEINLEGHVIHWARDAEVEKLSSQVEKEIEEIIGENVSIDIERRRIYSQPGLFGHAWEVSFSMVLVLTFLALFLVPNVIVVEKSRKTMDALLVSPASMVQLLLAKTIAGMFYYLVAAGVILALNWGLVVHLGILGLVIFGGGLFCVGLGLLEGYLLDRQIIVNAVSYALLMGLMAPIFLLLFKSYLPKFMGILFDFVPTVSFTKLLELAFSGEVFPEKILFHGAVLWLSVVFVWAILIWRVRRLDQ